MTYKDINLDKLVVIDIETLHNMFCLCARDYKTGAKKEFIIFDHKNYEDQAFKLYKFLCNCASNKYTFITFNGIGFDMQVLQFFFEWCNEKQDPLYELGNKFIIDKLYKKAQQIINTQNDEEKYKILVPENKFFIRTIDVYKQLHYDRPAKATSLKWIQFSTRYPIIEEMPISHEEDITIDDIESVVIYCWNDVDSTYEFFTKMRKETELRMALSKEYDRNLINASEPKMAREIFGKFLCEELGITYKELKDQKTIRKDVHFNNIIFPHIKFVTPKLQRVLADFNEITVDCNPHSKADFKYTFDYNGLKVDLGLGGIHSCTIPGVYTPKEDEEIIDWDVTSFYPMLAIQNDLKPAHLGETFCKIYNGIFLKRKEYDKKDPRNYVMKILLNSTYGLSSEINSYFYDKQFTYAITINGQLSLLMLVEALYASVPNIKFLQKNTDGVTFICKKEYRPILAKIQGWWEKTNKLSLEEALYSKMVIMDVNNYIAVPIKGDPKKKGLFETDMLPHKNPSAIIIPMALEQHFINNLTPKDFIISPERSIFDFCKGVKKKSNFKLNLIRSYNFAELIEEQQKVCRYIVSKKTDNSGLLVKDFEDGRRVSAQANAQIIPLNIIRKEQEQASLYPLDYEYYVRETQKIIEIISPSTTQTTLF